MQVCMSRIRENRLVKQAFCAPRSTSAVRHVRLRRCLLGRELPQEARLFRVIGDTVLIAKAHRRYLTHFYTKFPLVLVGVRSASPLRWCVRTRKPL